MRFSILGSGSSGNATLVDCLGLRILIDAGLSAKQLTTRLQLLGIDPATLSGILITHEHGDHVRGLKNFLKQHPIPVYSTHATARVVREAGIEGGHWKFFEAGQAFTLGEATIQSFPIQHDAVDPVGFVLTHHSRRLGHVSDVGHVTTNLIHHLRQLDALFIEANYDEALLEADTKRPWSIKQRISSRHGHLSNRQVANLLREIAHPGLRRVVLGHLSSDCNTPETALTHLRTCLHSLGHTSIPLHCATQNEPTEWFD
jgi:phosphoribosyl 1,2-cyclic phosphodiesterase